jgi:hypothetical protein
VTDGIQEIKETHYYKDGKERPIDCLIYGTGFVTDPRIYLKHFTCIGRNQIELNRLERRCRKLLWNYDQEFS